MPSITMAIAEYQPGTRWACLACVLFELVAGPHWAACAHAFSLSAKRSWRATVHDRCALLLLIARRARHWQPPLPDKELAIRSLSHAASRGATAALPRCRL